MLRITGAYATSDRTERYLSVVSLIEIPVADSKHSVLYEVMWLDICTKCGDLYTDQVGESRGCAYWVWKYRF